MEGAIKSKERAKKEYKEHVEKADTVAYAEILPETHDIMKVLIGNIPPLTEIDIEFSYIDKLDISMNKFRKLSTQTTDKARSIFRGSSSGEFFEEIGDFFRGASCCNDSARERNKELVPLPKQQFLS